jgi:hypothetical protein
MRMIAASTLLSTQVPPVSGRTGVDDLWRRREQAVASGARCVTEPVSSDSPRPAVTASASGLRMRGTSTPTATSCCSWTTPPQP